MMVSRSRNTKITRLALATAVMASGLALAGPTASADTVPLRNGVCDPDEFCLYWGFDFYGSLSDFSASVSNYGASQPTCYEFKGPGTGRYKCVKNNAASVWNRTTHSVRVYYNSGYGGAYQTFGAGSYGNLNSTLALDNASHKLL